jgi:hypothetical protein
MWGIYDEDSVPNSYYRPRCPNKRYCHCYKLEVVLTFFYIDFVLCIGNNMPRYIKK